MTEAGGTRGRVPGARRVAVTRVLPGQPGALFDLVADVRHHSRWIPLTSGAFPAGPSGDPLPDGPLPRGARFTMYSHPGIVDRMEVVGLDRPALGSSGSERHSLVLRKAGPLLQGTAGIDVEPVDHASSLVTWWEEVALAGPLPARLTSRLLAVPLGLMLRLALHRVARELDAG